MGQRSAVELRVGGEEAGGRVALITDAGNAWGQAMADVLAAAGYHLVLNSPHGAAEAAAGRLGIAYRLDRRAEAEAARHQIATKLGEVEVLIHTDNWVEPVSVTGCDEATIDRQLAANLSTAFFATQVFGGAMALKGRGRIFYVSSIHDEKPTGSAVAYAMAKGALKMLSREAALALGPSGVRVNLIEMGAMAGDDERFKSSLSAMYRDLVARVPVGAVGRPEEVARVILGLLSSQAKFVHGAEIRLDGGFLFHY